MAFDIFIDDSTIKPRKLLRLFLEDYDNIMDCLKNQEDFEILNCCLVDYYGEDEVYINALDDLILELSNIIKLFEINPKHPTLIFLNEFKDLVIYAKNHRKTIKFAGD